MAERFRVKRVDVELAFLNWPRLMSALRSGGAFNDPERPEGIAFATIKSVGRRAWPVLVEFIDCEDAMVGRAVVTVLNELTDRKIVYTPARKKRIKREWEKWLKRSNNKTIKR